MFYYAVNKGKNPGVYTTWRECKYQVDGISGCKYRKFNKVLINFRLMI